MPGQLRFECRGVGEFVDGGGDLCRDRAVLLEAHRGQRAQGRNRGGEVGGTFGWVGGGGEFGELGRFSALSFAFAVRAHPIRGGGVFAGPADARLRLCSSFVFIHFDLSGPSRAFLYITLHDT